MNSITRRQLLAGSACGILGLSISTANSTFSEETQPSELRISNAEKKVVPEKSSIGKPYYSLNTGTIMGFNLPIEEEIDVAAKAGYQGIEVWMSKVNQFLEKGKTIDELKKRLVDSGLILVNAISFPSWIVDDEQKRTEALEQMKREMELLAKLGCSHIAAPASGATNKRIDDLQECGKRYRTILDLGKSFGIIPILELWGASATLSRLSDCIAIAVASGHADASLLLDVYHLYRGGNAFESLSQISGKSLKVFHINDYPGTPERAKLTDAHRVYPGEGVAPIASIIKMVRDTGFCGALSLELFNRSYWESGSPLSVAKTGLEKMIESGI